MPYTLPIQTAALSEEALKRVKSDLGREPNETEKLIYSIMWAGACRSKSPLLIDAGKNLAIAVKAGRHNYSENIGDLVRSIAVCGARPLSLLFSAESAPGELEILIEDASKYANCAALAVSGGNIEVTDTLGKPDATIDFMALGVVEPEKLIPVNSVRAGMAIIYAGTPVSNSEIETDEPFELAVLLESLKKAVQKYNIAAVADIGSKGIVCAALRLASHSNVGIEIDADSLPISHDGVTLNDILLSQKRNRLLLAVDNNIADEIVEHFESMGIKASVAGVVNSTSMLTLNKNRGCAADIPVKSLLSGGVVKTVAIARERPKWIGVDDQFDQLSIPEPHALSQPMNYNTALIRLLESEIIGSKEFIYCRFDSRMGSINATPPGFNAALVNIGDERGAALSFSSASEYVHHDPRNSGKIAAARALRNVVCAGAKPVALLTLLTHEDSANNYGAVAAIEFEEGVAELVNEFTILKAVSVGGHNSVGAVGVVDNLRAAVTPFFKNEGDCIFLLGETRDEIGASAYLKIVHGTGSGKPPVLNIKREYSNQAAVYEAVQKGLIRSAHSCTMGGLACTLAECCVLNINQLLGAAINYDCGLRADRLLFSESESRTVLTVRPENAKAFTEHLLHRHVHFEEIGVVGGDSLIINSDINIDILTLAEAYKTKGLQS